jgi:hypothetical protein
MDKLRLLTLVFDVRRKREPHAELRLQVARKHGDVEARSVDPFQEFLKSGGKVALQVAAGENERATTEARSQIVVVLSSFARSGTRFSIAASRISYEQLSDFA